MKWHPVWWLFGLAALACGGTTRSQERETPSGGSGGHAPSSSGSGSSGKPDAGGSSSGASSKAGSSGVPTPSGGAHAAGGAGGSGFGQTSGGAAPVEEPSNLDCDQPYNGPMAAARSDGPAPIGSACEAIPDEVLLARYRDFKARVPTGFFYDAATQLEIWDAGCSSSVSEATAHSSVEGTPSGMFQTDWFYELVYCQEGTRRLFRSRRCDYFDGSTLSAPSPERLLFLSSLLWWTQNRDNSSSAQLGYNVQVGNATDWVEVCSISTAFGDFGLCDEITLESTRYLVRFDGQVELEPPTPIRTIQGQCH